MAVILYSVALTLLTRGCFCSLGQTDVGCKIWKQQGSNVCCEECHPGNRLVKNCGPIPEKLCVPCETGTYTLNPKAHSCTRCTECVGQVHLKDCTAKADTECGCRDGLTCGDERCSFCVDTCAKGYEPTKDRSCRPCPHGTFSDNVNQKCKPWSTQCPTPNQMLIKGNASSDIQCVTQEAVTTRDLDGPGTQAGSLMLIVVFILTTLCIVMIIIITTVGAKYRQRRKKKILPPIESINGDPSDNPRTLIAIECSFHEAQQEQGRESTEFLISKETSDQLSA